MAKNTRKKKNIHICDEIAQIKDVITQIETKGHAGEPNLMVLKAMAALKKKDKVKVVLTTLEKYYNAEELKPYQAELIKMQLHLERTGKKMVILFDGRDASGKGGTIRRVTRYMNEKRYRVVALGKPSEQQKTELHIKRYIEHFPRPERSFFSIEVGIIEPWLSRSWDFVRKINTIGS